MRKYEIYPVINDSDPLNFKKFAREVAERINNDPEMVERTRKVNCDFAEKLKKMLQDNEKSEYIGMVVLDELFKSHRYSYIKKMEHNRKEYEAEIDHLGRCFRLLEV